MALPSYLPLNFATQGTEIEQMDEEVVKRVRGEGFTWGHPTPGSDQSATRVTPPRTCKPQAGSLDTAAPTAGSTATPAVSPPHCSW